MACKSVFVTATGTDIGKTYVSALIVKKMRDLGLNCGYYKPALSGLNSNSISDVEYVQKVAGLDIEPMKGLSYSFEEPVSPHLAARRVGVEISLDKIIEDYTNLSKNFDYMVVEGAGGITCPFNLGINKLLLTDVIKAMNFGVLVVADGGLGTINSTLLTCEYAKSKDIQVEGVILNNFNQNDFMHQDNFAQVENLCGVEVVATVEKGAISLEIDDNVLKGLFDKC